MTESIFTNQNIDRFNVLKLQVKYPELFSQRQWFSIADTDKKATEQEVGLMFKTKMDLEEVRTGIKDLEILGLIENFG